MSEILQDWRDYLKFCLALKLDLKNTFVSMPKNLLNNYNSLISYTSDNKNKVYNNQIAQLYEKLHNIYSFKNDKFIIKIPKSAEEIINEGAVLCHCVGDARQDYIKNMANGGNVILFIRKIESPKKSYCTAEISKTEILQIREYRNKRVLDLDLESFINEWKNHLNKVK